MKKRTLRNKILQNTERSRKYFLLLFFIVLTSCSTSCGIAIFYSGNINGVYENCLCPKVSEGSILNHITFQKDSIGNKSEAIFINTGNYFALNNSKENNIALNLLDSLKYDVFSPGKSDLGFLNETDRLVSWNLGGALSFKIFNIQSKTVCVTGMIDPSLQKYVSKHKILEKEINTISSFIDSLRTFSDIIVFISNLDPEYEKKVFNQVKNIDIMISNADQKNVEFTFDKKIYVSSGASAEYIGKLIVEKTDKDIKYRNSFKRMDYDLIHEDEKSKLFVDSLKNKLGIKARKESIDGDL